MGAPVVHFEVNAKDAKRAQEFYSNLFSWQINANNPMNYGLVMTGAKTGINGGIGQVEADKPPFVTFYAEVDNPQAYLDRAVSLGGTVVMPVTEIPNMVTYALFADPEGNLVGIVKAQAPPQKEKPKTTVTRKRKAAKGKGRKSRRR
jgi:predicted enzyme related to lactoylglutathione lyase